MEAEISLLESVHSEETQCKLGKLSIPVLIHNPITVLGLTGQITTNKVYPKRSE